MKKIDKLIYNSASLIVIILIAFIVQSCNQAPKVEDKEIIVEQVKPEYFLLRPETEKAYGYSHAVKIGNDIKISGAVSMDDAGNPTAVGD
ncbi:MAG: RidA family protein, partial [Eudoraea sp.]|nr:RidA family protein [Eudoraea sp.]